MSGVMNLHGVVTQTHQNATANGTVEVDCYGYNSLMIWHEMTGQTSGGYVSLEAHHDQISTGPGSNQSNGGLLHPAPAGNSEFGANVKTAASNANYVTIYRGVPRYVGVTLNRTDGTHNVRVQPINLA